MQHSALRRRTTPVVMRHRVEAAKSSAAPRPPFPSTAQTVTGLSEPFFVSQPQPVLPFVAFADASQQLSSAPPLPLLSRHSATIHSAAAPPGACGANGHDRKQHHIAHPSRNPREVPPEKGEHRTKTLPLIRDFPQLFRASPPALPNTPQSRQRSVRPTASLGAKTPSISRFLPSDLHLCPFLPIFAAIHVRKTSHPPSSSGLGLDSSPHPAAAIGGENLSLPRQRSAYGAHRPQRRRTRRRVSRLPARQRSRQRPQWTARGRKRHARARPRAPSAPPMPSAPPFAGASARRQARQLQHLPFRARPLHRSHATSILLFRFHHGNTLSFRSTLDRSHGDCSRSAARPTDRLIFSPHFFFLFSSASAHSIE